MLKIKFILINSSYCFIHELGEKHFVHPTEDPFLETYLRPCKYYAESAHQKMQKFFKFKLKHQKLCENITVDSIKNVLEDNLLKYMPLRDKEGRRILYIHAGSKFIKLYTYRKAFY